MAESGKTYSVEKQIEALNQQYDALLERGAEFSVLRDIKDRLKELKRQLNGDGRSGDGRIGNGMRGDGVRGDGRIGDGMRSDGVRGDGKSNRIPGHGNNHTDGTG